METENNNDTVTFVDITKADLLILYNTLNAIAERTGKKKGLFYTEEQVQELKKDTTNIFL